MSETIATNGDWRVSKQENQRLDVTYLHLENTVEKVYFDYPVAHRTDELYLQGVATSATGKSCFYSIGYTNTLGDPDDLYSCIWHQGADKSRMLTHTLYDTAAFSSDEKTLYAFSDKGNRLDIFDAYTTKFQKKIALTPMVAVNPVYSNIGFFQIVHTSGDELWRVGWGKGGLILARLKLQGVHEKVVPLSRCLTADFQASSQGNLLVGNNTNGLVEMFDAATGAQLWQQRLTGNAGVRLSPDETLCAIVVSDHVNIYDACTGQLLRRLLLVPGTLEDFTFSTDSNRILTSFTPTGTSTDVVCFSQRAR